MDLKKSKVGLADERAIIFFPFVSKPQIWYYAVLINEMYKSNIKSMICD